MKVLVAYDTKYGNTQRVAELIAEGLKAAGAVAVVENMKKVNFDEAESFGAILMGSPNHMGRPTRTFKKFVDKLQKANLKDISLAAFDTYVGQKDEQEVIQPGGGEFQKALRRMEDHLKDKLPHLKLITPGLSIAVGGMKGPIVEANLPKCNEFGQKIASQL
ncbi:MAG: flavodoxin family protein [Candidatus Hermodarchaeota archaeon]